MYTGHCCKCGSELDEGGYCTSVGCHHYDWEQPRMSIVEDDDDMHFDCNGAALCADGAGEPTTDDIDAVTCRECLAHAARLAQEPDDPALDVDAGAPVARCARCGQVIDVEFGGGHECGGAR